MSTLVYSSGVVYWNKAVFLWNRHANKMLGACYGELLGARLGELAAGTSSVGGACSFVHL